MVLLGLKSDLLENKNSATPEQENFVKPAMVTLHSYQNGGNVSFCEYFYNDEFFSCIIIILVVSA